MKTSFFLTTFCLIALSIFLFWLKLTVSNRNTSISVNEDNETYNFNASYPAENTPHVQNFINSSIKSNGLFKSGNDYFNVNIQTGFYIEESPGALKITVEKRKNSTASCNRIKTMCEGIKDLLTRK